MRAAKGLLAGAGSVLAALAVIWSALPAAAAPARVSQPTPTPARAAEPDLLPLLAGATPPQLAAPTPRARIDDPIQRAGSQCQGSLLTGWLDDVKQARNIMTGWFKLDRYGYMRLKPNPSWRYQSTLNASGNGIQHSLAWALPLLRVGLAQGRADLVSRFYFLIDDWFRDNPIRHPRSANAYGQIESGIRMLTLACAARNAGSLAPKYLALMRKQAKWAAKSWGLVNNASFHQAAGIFAAGCVAGASKLQAKGLRFLDLSAAAMIAADGSVFEGSLEYARATYIWTLDQINRVSGCGVGPPASLMRATLIPAFLAYGVRPDGRYEALGDGAPKIALAADGPAGSTLRYAATAGLEGARPELLYAPFTAGFLFGRSSWGRGDRFRRQIFYSLRTGAGPSRIYHSHADAGSLTLAAFGSQLLFDSGQYGVDSRFKSRLAHNVLSVVGASAGSPTPVVKLAQSDATGDLTVLAERPYRKTKIMRMVWFDRVGKFFVVVDQVRQRKLKPVFQNWNLGRDRKVIIDGSAAHTLGSGANVSLVSVGAGVGAGPSYLVLRGSTKPWGGWNSQGYSEQDPAPSVRIGSARNRRHTLVTAIIPRREGVSPAAVTAQGQLVPDGVEVTVDNPTGQFRLRITASGVERL